MQQGADPCPGGRLGLELIVHLQGGVVHLLAHGIAGVGGGSLLGLKRVGGADGWLEFDYVPGEWEVRSRSADVGGKLVVIGSKLNETAIAQLFGC